MGGDARDPRDQVGVDPTGPAASGPMAGPPDLDHAIQAATDALDKGWVIQGELHRQHVARVAVEAAAPVLLQATRDRLADLTDTARAVLSCLHAGNVFTAESLLRHALDGPAAQEEGDRPTIVCLCGSTRFMDAFHAAGWRETLAGRIVLSVGVVKHGPPDHAAEALGPGVAEALDELHLRKIDLADEVLVLNVGGYIGSSTRREIAYAVEHGKPVRYLEEVGGGG